MARQGGGAIHEGLAALQAGEPPPPCLLPFGRARAGGQQAGTASPGSVPRPHVLAPEAQASAPHCPWLPAATPSLRAPGLAWRGRVGGCVLAAALAAQIGGFDAGLRNQKGARPAGRGDVTGGFGAGQQHLGAGGVRAGAVRVPGRGRAGAHPDRTEMEALGTRLAAEHCVFWPTTRLAACI